MSEFYGEPDLNSNGEPKKTDTAKRAEGDILEIARGMGFQELDSVETVRMLEDLIKKGIFGYPPPALNGITD